MGYDVLPLQGKFEDAFAIGISTLRIREDAFLTRSDRDRFHVHD